MNTKRLLPLFAFVMMMLFAGAQSDYHELYRPQIHFSPQAHWMNDPNGMVYYKGVYHLFYQYYPNSSVWGPMHWGHATTTDLIHWKHQPVALYPDRSGYIFSGSAVVDKNNTSGFGKEGKIPLVAIYTSHNPNGEKAGEDTFERQFIAYSLDDGLTWTKYKGNPVVSNPGIPDFRDPKVSWYEKGKKWVMILAVKDHASIYSSPDLKNWKQESDFGADIGAHGGVWECPDLFPLTCNGKEIWVAIVNINPGGPNGGSATQYFTGSFDGSTFTPDDTTVKWLDYGPDEYAGVTWSNTPGRRIFLGWMSNWSYATTVPTTTWRSANTLPRELSIQDVNGKYLIASTPVKELNSIASPFKSYQNLSTSEHQFPETRNMTTPYRLTLEAGGGKSLFFSFTNDAGEKLIAGFDADKNEYYIDRTAAGESHFNKDFAAKHTAPRLSDEKNIKLTIVMDAASVELFADDGLTVMTSIFFPQKLLNQVEYRSNGITDIQSLSFDKLKPVW